MKKGAKKKGSSKAGRKSGSTSSASKKKEPVVETSTQETQTQSTREAEKAAVKVEKNEDEVKEDQAEKEEEEEEEEEEAKPDNEDQEEEEEEDKEEAKEDEVVVKEEAKPDSAKHLNKDKRTSKNEQGAAASSSQPELRRGKRKRSTGKETEKKPTPRAKRARITTTKPQEHEPEYFKEKRNLEDLWKDAFEVGTEWDKQDAIYEFSWNFKNVEEALEEGGMLHGKKVYVFGCTESQVVRHNNKNKNVLVPAVVCIDSSIPPSDQIGLASVQGKAGEIVPMKDMKMAWVPYIPLEKRHKPVDRMNFPIFILGCTQRRSALKHLKEDRAKKFNCCLPYINNPFKEDESEKETVVQITFPSQPPVVCEYDWATDALEEFTDDLINKETLLVDQKDEFNDFVKEQIEKTKAAYEEAREKAKEGMSEETIEAYKAMKLYKFYPLPSPETPDVAGIQKSSKINKYFGKADEVF